MRSVVVFLLGVCLTACGGGSNAGGPTQPTPNTGTPSVPSGVSALVASMYGGLPDHIQSSLAENQSNLPRNPQIASFINAKIALLQRPALAAEIVNGRMFAETSVMSRDGRSIGVAVLFAEERLRGEAQASITFLQQALPILETFMSTPFPYSDVRLWYGFKVGNSGGGGALYMEDRSSYQARTLDTRGPYDAILAHELSHSYIGNETLNQFLELYVFNRVQGASTDLASWGFTRDYAGPSDANVDSALVVDVYQLLGHDAMSDAYRAVRPLFPPYGQPLAPAVIQQFVDRARDTATGERVAEKLRRIVF